MRLIPFAAYEEFEKNLVHELPEGEAIGGQRRRAGDQAFDAVFQRANLRRRAQCASRPRQQDRALKELVAEAQEPVLVAYTFKSDLARILRRSQMPLYSARDMGVIDRWNRGEIDMLGPIPPAPATASTRNTVGAACSGSARLTRWSFTCSSMRGSTVKARADQW